MEIEIKKAGLDEILPIRHTVLWPDKPYSFVQVEGDEYGTHFGLYRHGKLVTIISLFSEGESLRFRKFATLPEYQNQGLGKYMILFVMDYAKEAGFKKIWCDARADALPFYERVGFGKFSDVFDKSGIAYYKIEKIL